MARKTLIAISAVVLSSLLQGCAEKAGKPSTCEGAARPVKLMTVGEPEKGAARHYPAKVRANQRVKLAFQVSGRLISFPVKAGDRMTKGQTLAELDPRDFDNTLASATARYNESKADFERQSKLLEKKVVSVAVVEARRRAYEVSESEMKTAAKALEETKLKAPFDGFVAGTYVDNFQNIKAQDPVISLQDISIIELVLYIPEKDVIRSRAGMTLDEVGKIEFTAVFPSLGGRCFPLRIKEYETEADPDTQTFKAVMSMPAPPDANIMPGMTALVRVPQSEICGIDRGHWVPSAAVAEDSEGRRYVWRLGSGMKAHKQAVGIGAIKGGMILVGSGLSFGDRIAVAGVSLICEGMELKELGEIDGRKIAGGQ